MVIETHKGGTPSRLLGKSWTQDQPLGGSETPILKRRVPARSFLTPFYGLLADRKGSFKVSFGGRWC